VQDDPHTMCGRGSTGQKYLFRPDTGSRCRRLSLSDTSAAAISPKASAPIRVLSTNIDSMIFHASDTKALNLFVDDRGQAGEPPRGQ
jgi:hypothetical protein